MQKIVSSGAKVPVIVVDRVRGKEFYKAQIKALQAGVVNPEHLRVRTMVELRNLKDAHADIVGPSGFKGHGPQDGVDHLGAK